MGLSVLRALCLAFAAGLGLAGCGEEIGASQQEIVSRAYVGEGPPSLTLYTVVRVADGSGGHSALLIDGPQRVLFDPAGSFVMAGVPERGDVLYGISPRVQDVYIDYHARETFSVQEHRIEVSPETAALALRLAQESGAVGPARCAIAVASILRQLPGFEDIRAGWYPTALARQFANRPGVSLREITDTDADDNHNVLIRASQQAATVDG